MWLLLKPSQDELLSPLRLPLHSCQNTPRVFALGRAHAAPIRKNAYTHTPTHLHAHACVHISAPCSHGRHTHTPHTPHTRTLSGCNQGACASRKKVKRDQSHDDGVRLQHPTSSHPPSHSNKATSKAPVTRSTTAATPSTSSPSHLLSPSCPSSGASRISARPP